MATNGEEQNKTKPFKDLSFTRLVKFEKTCPIAIGGQRCRNMRGCFTERGGATDSEYREMKQDTSDLVSLDLEPEVQMAKATFVAKWSVCKVHSKDDLINEVANAIVADLKLHKARRTPSAAQAPIQAYVQVPPPGPTGCAATEQHIHSPQFKRESSSASSATLGRRVSSHVVSNLSNHSPAGTVIRPESSTSNESPLGESYRHLQEKNQRLVNHVAAWKQKTEVSRRETDMWNTFYVKAVNCVGTFLDGMERLKNREGKERGSRLYIEAKDLTETLEDGIDRLEIQVDKAGEESDEQ